MTSASEIVESYQAALSKGDFATARTLMQDNMTFQGPFDTFNTADQYLEATRRLASPWAAATSLLSVAMWASILAMACVRRPVSSAEFTALTVLMRASASLMSP